MIHLIIGGSTPGAKLLSMQRSLADRACGARLNGANIPKRATTLAVTTVLVMSFNPIKGWQENQLADNSLCERECS